MKTKKKTKHKYKKKKKEKLKKRKKKEGTEDDPLYKPLAIGGDSPKRPLQRGALFGAWSSPAPAAAGAQPSARLPGLGLSHSRNTEVR